MVSIKKESRSDSFSDTEDSDDLHVEADFSMDEAQIIDMRDGADESIEKYLKQEQKEPANPKDVSEAWKEPFTTAQLKSESPVPTMPSWTSQMQQIRSRATLEQIVEDLLK